MSTGTVRPGVSGRIGASPRGLPERRLVVERADHGGAHAVRPDHVLRDALHVLGGDRVEPGEQLLRLGRLALEHLAAQPEEDQPVRALGLQHEPALRERAGLLELVRGHRLVGQLAELVGDHATASSARWRSTPACDTSVPASVYELFSA